MIWTELERRTEDHQQVNYEYDQDGNPIEGSKTVFNYSMVYTLIEYSYPEHDAKVTVEVTHFNPQSEADIELGINNRGITEERKLANQE